MGPGPSASARGRARSGARRAVRGAAWLMTPYRSRQWVGCPDGRVVQRQVACAWWCGVLNGDDGVSQGGVWESIARILSEMRIRGFARAPGCARSGRARRPGADRPQGLCGKAGILRSDFPAVGGRTIRNETRPPRGPHATPAGGVLAREQDRAALAAAERAKASTHSAGCEPPIVGMRLTVWTPRQLTTVGCPAGWRDGRPSSRPPPVTLSWWACPWAEGRHGLVCAALIRPLRVRLDGAMSTLTWGWGSRNGPPPAPGGSHRWPLPAQRHPHHQPYPGAIADEPGNRRCATLDNPPHRKHSPNSLLPPLDTAKPQCILVCLRAC